MIDKIYDTYGSRTLSADQLRAATERALGIVFDSHESSFSGSYYFAGDLRGENFVIQANDVAVDDDGVLRPDLATYSVILLVNATTRADELRTRLKEIEDLEFVKSEVP